jgi:hypothetical protein
MATEIPEADWKVLSRLKPLALERLCRRILRDASNIIARAAEGEYYRTYMKLYEHIQKKDKDLNRCFNDWRRSQALWLLMEWRREHLITDEEFAAFTPETRAKVDDFLKISR